MLDVDSLIHVEELSYRYPQHTRSLELAALDVRAGEVVLLTGPSGCGKSTFARCLAGLIPHLYRGDLGGRVVVDGLDTAGAPLWRLTERMGMVFQNPASQMLASTVEEEIVFGLETLGLPRSEIGARLEESLTGFGLHDLRDRSPLALSGGEQQRLALAAISARRPAALVLDEPLSMLDSMAMESLVTHLAELSRRGTSIIICEHRTEPLQRIPGIRVIDLGDPEAEHAERHLPTERLAWRHVEPFTLDVRGLSVRLGSRDVLHGLEFSAASGQVLSIAGRNGVGKTTLLRALAGLQHFRGTVQVGGKQPDLAMVFQNPDLQLFNATVNEEILYKVSDPDLAWHRWLISALGLREYKSTPPLLLSEGEKKRVALAIALMRKPSHGVLLDEPALGQDAAHKARLIQLARALAHTGRLVVMTTHDLSLAAQADRLLLLGETGFVADGPPDEVLRDKASWTRAGLTVPDWVLEQIG
ncbi:MAG: ATP-binding cassette domain-containing protein [Anaerolineae bacterium]|nr:ATP-binding cassette domain-containing protein [Anaerolineae bacterium]